MFLVDNLLVGLLVGIIIYFLKKNFDRFAVIFHLYRWYPLKSLTLFLSTCKLFTSYRNPLHQTSHHYSLGPSIYVFHLFSVINSIHAKECWDAITLVFLLSNFTLKFHLRNPAATRRVSPNSYRVLKYCRMVLVDKIIGQFMKRNVT